MRLLRMWRKSQWLSTQELPAAKPPLVTGWIGSIHVYGRRSRRRRAAGGPKRVGDGPEIVSPKRTSVGYGTQPPAWFTVTPYPKCANDGHPRADYSGPLSLR